MVGVLLLTHGDLGDALLRVVTMLIGPQEQAGALGLNPGDQIDIFREMVREAAEKFDGGDGVLLLVDVAGGSPANIACEMVDCGNRAVVTGVNLPMLLELFIHRRSMSLNNLAEQVKKWGQEGISALKLDDIRSEAL